MEESAAQYPAVYRDTVGEEQTVIVNDGEQLRLVVRGVRLEGDDFDGLEASDDADPAQLATLSFNGDCLCSCSLEWQMPIPVQDNDKTLAGVLSARLMLGAPAPNGGSDSLQLGLVLAYGGRRYEGPGASGWFEHELLAIQKQLPAGVFMRACINCLYSDYSPFGSGLFGGMMCFRNIKEEYLQVRSKQDFWSVHDRSDRFVQETYLCDDFTTRAPNTGYRG